MDLSIGIDIGGTFTDFVVYQPEMGRLVTFKRLSTPGDPAQAVLDGLKHVQALAAPPLQHARLIHGSTVATNALLERKGARTALVTTAGFADLLQIGRQNRPALYDWTTAPPPPLVPPGLRFEISERIAPSGQVLQALEAEQVDALVPRLQAGSAEAVAVCLLFSFANPAHEQAIADRLRHAGFNVSLSSEILPEYREYERASTTAVNAYVTPTLDRYLGHLQSGLGEAISLRIMQSNGGAISVGEARRNGVRCILSGPAGGVVGAAHVAGPALAPEPLRLLTFDMGGTSTDVSLIDGAPQLTSEAVIGGCPIRIPLLDIHTIGAGGGSLAAVDPGGALRVGPRSAGANPGPACYGRGELPTVTDANVVLGYIPPEYFLGGQMPLDAVRARQALEQLGNRLGLSAEAAALGVTAVVNAHMERALRVISVERGHDPRRFTLLSFGGAGGLHAAALRRSLGIPRLLVPPLASTLSAFGMLAADVVKDYTHTVMLPGDTPLEQVGAWLAQISERGRAELQAEGIPPSAQVLQPAADLRYCGQSYELGVPFGPSLLERFHAAHQQAYGYALPQAPVEIVNLRLRAIGRVTPPALPELPDAGPDPAAAYLEHRPIHLPGGPLPAPLYRGEALQAGNRIAGPALIVRPDTTILLGPGDCARVDRLGNLIIEDQA